VNEFADWIQSGQLTTLIICMIAVEALLLWGPLRSRLAIADRMPLLLNLGAGVALVGAVHAVLIELPWQALAAALAAALGCHLGEMWWRLKD